MSAAHRHPADNIPLPETAEQDEILDASPLGEREHFIPLRKADLLRLLVEQHPLPAADRAAFVQLCRRLEAALHHEYHALLEDLKEAYAPFDPDADTRPGRALTEDERDALAGALFDRFVALLERCKFRRLGRADLEAAMATVSDWGVNLNVDFEVFDRLEVFARGDRLARRQRRRWQTYYRLEEVEVPIYQRLVLIFRLNDPNAMENAARDAVYIKIFKNIHKHDLEMLLPGTSVRMTLIDRTKIAFPTISGLGMSAYKATQLGLLGKLLKGGLVAALAGGIWGLTGFLLVAATMIGYAVKSFFSYLTTKNKYQLNLTRSLYFQNLDSNAGVLARLIDEAEEQECREAFLGWFLLWRHAGERGWSIAELDRRAEAFLQEHAGVEVDFHERDAVEKLLRLQVVERTAEGRFVAPPLELCNQRLDCAWRAFFPPAWEADC